ncbi:MAG: endonuclease/exonuclease/phosphatase family protein [Dysgonamonadaceae bacterium]|nr:endonuclease/exonuclease/phosphatase family protein [Dysgonamonadaceae bacterium]
MKTIYYTLTLFIFSLSIVCGCKSTTQKNETLHLKIASYNVRNARGIDDVTDFDRVAAVINNMDADAVAIQELDSATERSMGLVVLDELASRTNMHATFNGSIKYLGGEYGIGVLTKEKPLRKEAIALPGKREMRSLLIVEMEDYVFCCTHLDTNEAERQASIELVMEATNKYTNKPVFLTGDLNASPTSKEIIELSQSWIMLSDPTQPTYRSDDPEHIIDYIFLKSNSKFSYNVIDREVVNEPMASDHRPLWVELEITNN